MKRFTDLGSVELRVFTPDCLYCLSEAGSEPPFAKEWVGFRGFRRAESAVAVVKGWHEF